MTQGALHRRWAGAFPAVITAGICDTILISGAVLGLSAAAEGHDTLKAVVSWVGVLFLIYMGWTTWRSEPKAGEQPADEAWPMRRQVMFAASVSLLNPHAILDTLGIIGNAALDQQAGAPRLAFTLTCIAVSWVWFTLLAVSGRLLGVAAAGQNRRRWLNRASALIMWVVAAQFLYSLL
jgi:L-lysine exporter family protein LysE/ArgO